MSVEMSASGKKKAETGQIESASPKKAKTTAGAVLKVTSGQRAKDAGAASFPQDATPRSDRAPGRLTCVHWNVGGLNGLLNNPVRRGLLERLILEEEPDVLAISEHKYSEEKLVAGQVLQQLVAVLPVRRADGVHINRTPCAGMRCHVLLSGGLVGAVAWL